MEQPAKAGSPRKWLLTIFVCLLRQVSAFRHFSYKKKQFNRV